MKIKIIYILLLIASVIPAIQLSGNDAIHDYGIFFGIIDPAGKNSPEFILRKFKYSNAECLLTVDAGSLQTSIKYASKARYEETGFPDLIKKYGNTNYVKALAFTEKNSESTRNAGITHLPATNNGAILTADLCPSGLSLDRKLFDSLIKEFSGIKSPVPVSLCITGLWIERHKDDLQWLKQLEEKQKLSITWINHSYNHFFKKNIPDEKNFLLLPGTDISKEILNTEKRMIESGILPSVFFRFPGLISGQGLFKKIKGYGLIPIGSDAWLAKGQQPNDGGIILVHANGNEPAGILRFLALLAAKREDISARKWLMHDLKSSIIKNMEQVQKL